MTFFFLKRTLYLIKSSFECEKEAPLLSSDGVRFLLNCSSLRMTVWATRPEQKCFHLKLFNKIMAKMLILSVSIDIINQSSNTFLSE